MNSIVKKVTNFFSVTKVVPTQTQHLHNNYQEQEDNTLETITYNCGVDNFQNSLKTLTTSLVDTLYARVFVDSLKTNKINGISNELISSGVFFEYYLDFVKSNSQYKLYVKRQNNTIIAINNTKIDDTFEELQIVKNYTSNKYESTVMVYSQLSNYIISNIKKGDIANFLVFKKNCYNSLFNLDTNVGGSEYSLMVDTKQKQVQEQLSNISSSLLDSNKSSMIMIDKEDDLSLLAIDYSAIEKNIDGIFKTISLVTGLPDSYLSGKFSSSLSGNHSGDLEAKIDSINGFFKGEIIPFLNILGIENEKITDNTYKILKVLDIIKDLPEETKKEVINQLNIIDEIKLFYNNLK